MATSAIQKYFAGLSRNTFLLAFASLFADISTEMLYAVLQSHLGGMLYAAVSSITTLRESAASRAAATQFWAAIWIGSHGLLNGGV
jgi:hypothetical protein